MSTLSDHVQLTIVKNTVGISAAGFGTPLILSHSATWVERTRTYGSMLDVVADWAVGTPEYGAANALFAQSPCPQQIKIGRAALKPTQQYAIGAIQAINSDPYSINVVGPGITTSTATYTSDSTATTQEIHNGLVTALNAVTGKNYTAAFASLASLAPQTFVVLSQALGELTITAHGLNTGDGPVQLTTTGTLPTGLALATNYWVIKFDANTIQLATSLANAFAGTVIVLSTAGSGTMTETPQAGALSPILPLLVTGSAPGNWFSLEVTDASLLSNKQTHADPGIATDLNNISLKDDDWYALITLFNSPQVVAAAASNIEAKSKIYVFDVNETDAINTVVGNGDTLDAQHTLARSRSMGCYHPSPTNFFAAAWLGRMLPILPGSDDWKWKVLSGVAPVTLTSTNDVNLRARSANTIQTVAGANITWEGNVASSDFIDNTRGVDWLQDDMTKGVYAALINAGKVPFTDNGIALVESEIRASLRRAISNGILTNSPAPVVTVPKAANVTQSNRALRILPNITFSANLAGAVHKVQISGVVSV